MKLEDQVCSLALAKRLKELGVKQESYFGWYHLYRFGGDSSTGKAGKFWEIHLFETEDKVNEYAAAFTVAELGDILPDEYPGDSDSALTFIKTQAGHLTCWYARYVNEVTETVCHAEFADTEADARAKMLVHLIENSFIAISRATRVARP